MLVFFDRFVFVFSYGTSWEIMVPDDSHLCIDKYKGEYYNLSYRDLYYFFSILYGLVSYEKINNG